MSRSSSRDSQTSAGGDAQEENVIEAAERSRQSQRFQLAIVWLIQFAEPVTAQVIYPFINQFVRATGVTRGDEKKTGYYAGIIESLFFLGESLTALPWQLLSDTFGRKPVLVLGPLGLTFAMLGFGLSKAFWSLVLFRALQGVCNGNIGVSKTVLAELTTPENRAQVFAGISVMWAAGVTIAPILGGVLSYPEDHFPNSLGRIRLLREYPYFLPCAAAGAIAFLAFLSGFVGLRETSPAKLFSQSAKKKDTTASSVTPLLNSAEEEGYGAVVHTEDSQVNDTEDDEDDKEYRRPSIFSLLSNRSIFVCLSSLNLLAFGECCNSALQPLVFSTSVANGGLAFDSFTIGRIMGIWGVPNALVQLFVSPKLVHHFGPKKVFILAMIGIVLTTIMYPLENWFARQAGGVDWKVWALIVAQLCAVSCVHMGFSCVGIFLVGVSPTKGSLGAINGLAQTMAPVTRALAPAFANSLFALSTANNLMGGYMVFFILTLLSLLAVQVTLLLPTELQNKT